MIFNKFVEKKNFNNRLKINNNIPQEANHKFLNINYNPQVKRMMPTNMNNMMQQMWNPNIDPRSDRRFNTIMANNIPSPMMISNNSPSMMNHYHQSPMIRPNCFCGNNMFPNPIMPTHYSPQYINQPKKKKKNDPFALLRTAGNSTDEESNRINLESVTLINLDLKR